ncbi:MAG: type II secretion system protein [Sulfuricurvum sp.]
MRFQHTRRGFTFIELLFVIVILGIVGGIALEAVRQYYEGIFKTQEYSRRVAEADHILDQLTKYFENAIDKSIVNLDENKADGALDGTCVGRPTDTSTGDYTVAFVGVDNDSLRTTGKPGWSETVAPVPFTGTTLTSDDADFSAANAIITGLYPTSDLANSAIYNHQGAEYGCQYFNWNADNNLSAYYTINGVAGNTLTLINNAVVASPDNDRKYLLRTGYAFRVLNDGTFMMYTNFRPWKGELYTAAVKQNILGQNVAHLYVDSSTENGEDQGEFGLVWRLKVCMRGLDANLSTTDTESQAICRERRVHVRY